jgi:S-adenosylmethionine:tRNA ribosyltransferase-isomerase
VTSHILPTLDFDLPPERSASAPPEARGLTRDAVSLMVSYPAEDRIVHTQFARIGDMLQPDDVVVINTSGTLNAALPARSASGQAFVLHLSTHQPTGEWVIEVRQPEGAATVPFSYGSVGERYQLPAGGMATLLSPYGRVSPGRVRLWRAQLELPQATHAYLNRYGTPIRYRYVPQRWEGRYYQTVYATEPGSAEMPSAGRAFTPEIITGLVARGVQVVPLLLHTGVSSLEDHEPPYAEWYRVPAATARAVNAAHAAGGRVIAIGTTVVRALETVTDERGVTHGGEGWTEEIISGARGVRAANGLLTGLHEPRATHLALLEAFTPRVHLAQAYAEALQRGYLWHEFGDLHLLLNPARRM